MPVKTNLFVKNLSNSMAIEFRLKLYHNKRHGNSMSDGMTWTLKSVRVRLSAKGHTIKRLATCNYQ